MIRVICTCGRAFKAEDRHAGKRTKCPECGASLTIGPAPISSSSGGGAKEVPAWWYPSEPTAQAERATAPTRSGSDPGADAANTMVLPPGFSPKPQASSQRPTAASSTSGQVSPPRAPVGPPVPLPGSRPFPVTMLWAIASATVALLILAVCATLWLRSPTSKPDEISPARRGAELGNSDNLAPNKPSPSTVPSREPASSDNTIASTSTTNASGDISSSKAKGDVGLPSKSALAGASRRLRLLVPVYIFPAGEGRNEWRRLIDAAAKVEIVAIANPNSGPGNDRNPDYDAIFTEASARGVTLLGYVSTDYGKRPQAEIQKDVEKWVRFYPQIRGFFFDQQPSESRGAIQFAELRDFVKQRMKDSLVITNPGVACDQAYLARNVSNVTCVFNDFAGFDQFELPPHLKGYDPARFAAMPYNIPDVEKMQLIVKEAIIKRIGYLYISDAKPPNSWGKLPAYWEAEVDAVSRVR
jgi:Spherulation-specific family 4